MGQIPESLTKSIASIIRRKANKIVRQSSFTSSDVDDIKQDLYLKVLRNLDRHDPQIGTAEAFVQTIVDSQGKNILRDRRAAKRNPSRAVSLHITVKVDADDAVELAQQISQRELDKRICVSHRDQREEIDLLHDMAEVIAQIPHPDRQLFRALKRESVSEIARRTGIPRTTLHSKISKYRQLFEAAGLRDYLK